MQLRGPGECAISNRRWGRNRLGGSSGITAGDEKGLLEGECQS